MKIENSHIQYIRTTFNEMQSRDEFLGLLNFVKPLIFGEKTKPFEVRQLTFYANPKRSVNFYKTFEINKKSGGTRTINAPTKGLKALQKTLNVILQCVFQPHNAATGFVWNKSVVDNARIHVGNNYVLNIDLKDFFSSIDQARVWACLKLKPFNLTSDESDMSQLNTGIRKIVTAYGTDIYYKVKNGEFSIIQDKKGNYKKSLESFDGDQNAFFEDLKKYIFSDSETKILQTLFDNRLTIANMIAGLCCTSMKVERLNEDATSSVVTRNVLPQGAPTSPVLSNVVCQRLDYLLTGLAKRFSLKYSRYADDITFSSMHHVYKKDGEFMLELRRIITNQNFQIKESKNRLQKTGYRKEVTGLLVNEKVNVSKRYIKQLRMWLYYWEQYGYAKAKTNFFNDYIKNKKVDHNKVPNFINLLRGKLDYLKMVKGSDDSTFKKLDSRFNLLVEKHSLIQEILDEWDNNGIENAIDLYDKN